MYGWNIKENFIMKKGKQLNAFPKINVHFAISALTTVDTDYGAKPKHAYLHLSMIETNRSPCEQMPLVC